MKFSIKLQNFSLMKLHLKTSSVKWRHFLQERGGVKMFFWYEKLKTTTNDTWYTLTSSLKMKRKQAVHFDGDVTLEYVAAVRSLSLSSVFCSSLIDRSRPCWTMTAGVVVPRTRQSCHVMHTSTQVGPGAGFNMKTIFLRIGFPIIKRRSW